MIYGISYKTLIGSKPLQIRLDKIDGIIRIYDRTRYLTMFDTKKYDAIYDKIRCLIKIKSGITYYYFSLFAKIKVYSYDSLPIENTFILYNVIIHIKSVLNKDKNHYYYKILLGKYSNQLAKK